MVKDFLHGETSLTERNRFSVCIITSEVIMHVRGSLERPGGNQSTHQTEHSAERDEAVWGLLVEVHCHARANVCERH